MLHHISSLSVLSVASLGFNLCISDKLEVDGGLSALGNGQIDHRVACRWMSVG